MTDEQIERQKAHDRSKKREYRKDPALRAIFAQKRREWGRKNRAYLREYMRGWYQRHKNDPAFKAKARERTRAKRLRNPEYEREYRNRLEVREATKVRSRSWYLKNRERHRENHRLAMSRQRAKDVNVRLLGRLRCRLNLALRGQTKSGSASKLLGCSLPDFKIYMESKFEPDMNWENWGQGNEKWHIDHIIPCSLFDLAKPEHQKRCFHFSNLQPLWSLENIAKGNRIGSGQFRLL